MEAILRRASSISFLSSLSLCFLPDNLVLASEITFHCWASLCFSASMAFIIASTSCCKWETHTFCEISRKYCRIFLYTKLDFNNRLSMYRFSEKKGQKAAYLSERMLRRLNIILVQISVIPGKILDKSEISAIVIIRFQTIAQSNFGLFWD